ncbi:hypothetical protein Scep_005907 [Stephania cephalantha]|uniref:AB hydrolase-1 domain-containing protein n=1 Tax=Stephania cephalantha TaxID=152367 RepID=A0AAP0KWN6_9MAGN
MLVVKERLHFVLVHGFGGGGWVFYKIRPLLEKLGHKVSCPDLKSAGIDSTDPKTIQTFQQYDQPLFDLLSTLPNNDKVILVGHSSGGVSLTHAIHNFPHKIHVAVFVAATMLQNGFSTQQDFADGIPNLFLEENGSEGNAKTDPTCTDQKQLLNDPELGMHLCPPEDIALFSMLQKEGPYQVIRDANFKEDRGADVVPRVYIKSMHDRVVIPKQQESMLKRWPPSQVYSVESDHYPFVSKPLDVFGILIKIAANVPCKSGTWPV